MSMKNHVLAAGLLSGLLITASSASPAVIPTPAFKSVQLRGMGHVIIRHGDVQRVTLLKGDSNVTQVHMDRYGNDQLVIDACRNDCPSDYELVVEIVTPAISGVAIDGSGKIETQGSFPRMDRLNAAINGSGDIDVHGIAAERSDAAISGSGNIKVTTSGVLNAAISGSGTILYWGSPQVRSAISGSGTIRSAG
jgi:hypothetical protein